jgi:hypothetical protein
MPRHAQRSSLAGPAGRDRYEAVGGLAQGQQNAALGLGSNTADDRHQTSWVWPLMFNPPPGGGQAPSIAVWKICAEECET